MEFNTKEINNYFVTEWIQGLVETYPELQYLDGFPKVKVVLHTDVSGETVDKVAVISGGGSGHEPYPAGFVGKGMLTAGVCGDVSACPPADSILAGIQAMTGPAGCLLIYKNYPEEVQQFTVAADQAISEGYLVEKLIVGDECTLPVEGGTSSEKRGLAGTILIYKVAGAAAFSGLPLPEVVAVVEKALQMVYTMGIAVRTSADCFGPHKMELGVGIHGEQGALVDDLKSVRIAVSSVLEKILATVGPIKPSSKIVLMINGLGDIPLARVMIASGKAVHILKEIHGLFVDRVYTGSFMTSVDMAAGFSVTVMTADEEILNYLDAPTNAPSWPAGAVGDHVNYLIRLGPRFQAKLPKRVRRRTYRSKDNRGRSSDGVEAYVRPRPAWYDPVPEELEEVDDVPDTLNIYDHPGYKKRRRSI